MIKFFRKIRQRLLTDIAPSGAARAGKFNKYLIYAIGEIVLVVIGILIAITLNSHYQNKSSKTEREVKLEKLQNVIYNDSIAFSRSIQNSENFIVKIDSLQQVLNSKMNFNSYKDFVRKFKEVNSQFRTFKPNSTVYNELINSASFSKIENQELKDNISRLYGYYDHFGGLISAFTDGFIATHNNLYSSGIISYKYFNLEQTEEEMSNGYEEFKTILKDKEKFRILENYIYSERQLHITIIGLYQNINNYFMNGLPRSPTK